MCIEDRETTQTLDCIKILAKGNLPTTCNSSADLVSCAHVQYQPSFHRSSSKRNWGKENKQEKGDYVPDKGRDKTWS